MNTSPLSIDEIQASLPESIILESYIKSGGQGDVFRGSHNGIVSAIKLFNKNDPEISKRIDREIKFLKECKHENIVKVLDACDVSIRGQDVVIVAYEFISGGDLIDNFFSSLPINEIEVIRIGFDVSKAIKCMWDNTDRL